MPSRSCWYRLAQQRRGSVAPASTRSRSQTSRVMTAACDGCRCRAAATAHVVMARISVWSTEISLGKNGRVSMSRSRERAAFMLLNIARNPRSRRYWVSLCLTFGETKSHKMSGPISLDHFTSALMASRSIRCESSAAFMSRFAHFTSTSTTSLGNAMPRKTKASSRQRWR